jgi:CDP-diacylglycerol--serine O-phosphatidyltransferase
MGIKKNLKAIKDQIPNTLTCCNLFSGCIAITMAQQHKYKEALMFIIIGSFFDFFDGAVARLLKAHSPLGKDLDSLADDVTFGAAPGFIVYFMLSELNYPSCFGTFAQYVPFIGFAISAFSALRLAKFNIDTRQTTSFIGMPTPANALFWGSFVYGQRDKIVTNEFSCFSLIGVIALIMFTSWLLVCEVPMFSLKFKTLKFEENKLRFLFLALSIILVICMGLKSFAPIITLYVCLAIIVPIIYPDNNMNNSNHSENSDSSNNKPQPVPTQDPHEQHNSK